MLKHMPWHVILALALPWLLAGPMAWRFKHFRRLLLCVSFSLAVPALWVGGVCWNDARSEACVWGKAFLPLYLGFAAGVVGPALYVLITAAGGAGRSLHRRFKTRQQ